MKEFKDNEVCKIVHSCKYHVVWCVKYKRKLITPEISKRILELAYEVAEENGATISDSLIKEEQCHFWMEVDPQFGVHRMVKAIKAKTSKVLRAEFPELKSKLPSLWTNSYFITTVAGTPFADVEKYINSQETSQRK